MPSYPGDPPQAVRGELAALGVALDAAAIPRKTVDGNVLIATWNIRHLAAVTEKWETTQADSPKRNLRDLLCLAAIVSRFDVVAIQEVRRDLRACDY
jgi:hypothetical protein